MSYDVLVIGGGAAGLAASVFLGRAGQGRRILLIEKAPRVGKKLMATGNGTCNLTNVKASAADYHGAPRLAQAALEAFSVAETIDFFTSIGVDCAVREDGKVYPLSEQAGAVLDALRLEAQALGVEIICDCKVTALKKQGNDWCVMCDNAKYVAEQVLVTVGGAAAPALGGSAEGYRLLTDLGCEKKPLFPSIVQIRTATDYVRAVKGIRVDAALTLRMDGRVAAQSRGEVLFADYGLSGPAVMFISRPVADWERQKRGEMVACLDLLPDWDSDTLCARIRQRSELKGRTLEDLLTGLLHKRVGQTILRVAEVLPLTREVETLTEDELKRITRTIKNWKLPVTGTQGFGGAQVTAGGIAATEIDPSTFAIKRLPGVYAAGEVLDVDGDCGGFNLQFAWSSAYVAAQAIQNNR
ncbi:MAG: aminoacetone oxidase family FAD-binding enzyme [Clostridia bacterium]|nr:aminoacetone oxidase family FAD-binding enzyme [Clostridia bacterium]